MFPPIAIQYNTLFSELQDKTHKNVIYRHKNVIHSHKNVMDFHKNVIGFHKNVIDDALKFSFFKASHFEKYIINYI